MSDIPCNNCGVKYSDYILAQSEVKDLNRRLDEYRVTLKIRDCQCNRWTKSALKASKERDDFEKRAEKAESRVKELEFKLTLLSEKTKIMEKL